MSRKLMMNNVKSNGLYPVTDGLICWLDGRDGSGTQTTWIDRSGNSNDAIITNCMWTGKALRVNNNSDSFLVNKLLISSDFSPFTLEINFKNITAKPGIVDNIIMANSTKSWGYSSSIYKNNQRLFLDVGNSNISNSFELNKSYQVGVIKYNNASRKPLLDGTILEYPNSIGTDGISFLGNFDTNHMIGDYHSIRLYNRILTQEEITQNYNYEQSITRT